VFGTLLEEHFAVGEHARQHVVEVVRDAGGQPSDRFHLLRLAQSLLEQLAFSLRVLALRDVHHCADILETARFIPHSMSHDIKMFDPAIRHLQSILVSKVLPILRGALHHLPEVSNVSGVNSLHQ